MANPGDITTTTATVEIEMLVESVSFTAEGIADILYRRTITDTADQSVLVRDVVRETKPIHEAYGGIADSALTITAAEMNHGKATYTKQKFDEKSKAATVK